MRATQPVRLGGAHFCFQSISCRIQNLLAGGGSSVEWQGIAPSTLGRRNTMTQYLISLNHDTAEAPTMATMDPAIIQPIIDAVDAFNQKLRKEGAWVFAGGLHPIQTATTVDNTGESPVVTDGPHAQSEEYLGGFWVIEASDLETALGWAKEASKACSGQVEVRAFQDDPA
jgi:hypothetical protein